MVGALLFCDDGNSCIFNGCDVIVNGDVGGCDYFIFEKFCENVVC